MANIETTVELNKLLKEQNKLLQAQAKIMKSQAASMKAMITSMQKMPVEEVSKSFQEMNDAIKDADKALEDFSSDQQKAFEGLNEGAQKATNNVSDMTDKIIEAGKKSVVIGGVATAFMGLNAGLRAGLGLFGSLASVAGTLTKTFFSLTASIIAIPFKMMSALMEEAASWTGTEFRQAIEDLRKEMGQLSTNESKAVMGAFRNMRTEGTKTGLSLYRTFGNMAERLKEMTRIAVAMGRQFTNMTEEFMSHGRQIGEYIKGLGFSEDGIRAVTQNAAAAGKSFTELSREITTMAFGMGDAFGINGKLISKDIADMMADFDDFGTVGASTMSKISVFTRKLGIEIKDLQGLIKQFDDFENAAQSAAQLSQAFGIQVDTLQMLKEQDPAARFESIRKAFLATGRTVENLTRQELNLLSAQTGIATEALKVGFSQAKAGLSYEEVQKQAAATEKKQLSQAEAMAKLSDSIELLVKQGQQMQGGFFDIFFQGFSRGIKISGPFRVMLRTLNRAMHTTRMAGMQVGRMFVEHFPGIKDIFEGLTEAFRNFGHWTRKSNVTKFLGDVVKAFKTFYKTLKTDPTVALDSLFKDLSKAFFDKFDKDTPAGKKVLGGFKKFFMTMGQILASGIAIAMKGLTKGLSFLTDLIKDPSAALKGAKQAQSGVVKFFMDIFTPAFKAIRAQWPELKNALIDLFTTAWDAVKPIAEQLASKAKDLLIKAAVGAFLTRGLVALTLGGIAKAGEKIVEKGAPMLAGSLGKLYDKIPGTSAGKKATESLSSAIEGATSVGGKVSEAGKSFGKFNLSMGLLGKVALGLTVIAGVAVAMAGSFLLINKILEDVSMAQAGKVAAVLGVMGMLYLEAAAVIAGSFAVGTAILSTGGIAAGAILAGVATIAAITQGMVTHVLNIIKDIDKMKLTGGLERKVKVFTTVIDAMSSMGEVMLSMMEETGSIFNGLINLFRGRNPMAEGLKAMEGIMNSLSVHVSNVIAQIVDLTRNITPSQLKAGEMVGNLLGAVAGIAQALIPPPELTGNFFEKLIEIDTLGAVSSYMMRTVHVIKSLIPSVIETMKEIGGIPASALNVEAINVFSSFMGSLSTLLNALTPPPDLIKNLKNTVETSAVWGLVKTTAGTVGDPTQAMQPVIAFMKSMMKNLVGEDGILKDIQSFMNNFVKQTTALGNPEQVLAASKIFETTMNAFGTVAELFSPEKLDAFKKAGGTASSGELLSHFNNNVMTPLAQDLPKLVGNFQSIGKDVGKIKGAFIDKVAKGVRDMITEIEDVTNQLSKFEISPVRVELKKVSDSLGLHGSEELKIKLNNIDLTVHVDVALDADKFEEALITRPKGSKFVIKGGKAGR